MYQLLAPLRRHPSGRRDNESFVDFCGYLRVLVAADVTVDLSGVLQVGSPGEAISALQAYTFITPCP